MEEDDIVPMDIDVSLNVSNTSNRSEMKAPSPVLFDSTELQVFPTKLQDSSTISDEIETITTVPSLAVTKKSKRKKSKRKMGWKVRISKDIHRKTNNISLTRCLCFLAVIISLSLHFIYNFYSIKCNPELNRNMVKQNLHTKLYGQNKAVELIVESLGETKDISLTFFVGGTGVGKTYAADIIFNSMKNSTNAFHVVAPAHRNKDITKGILQMIPICKYNLLIIDGLGEHDLDVDTFLHAAIEKSQTAVGKLHIILIFSNIKVSESLEKSVNYVLSKDRLNFFFEYLDVPINIIEFAPLRQEHLIKCIEYAMQQADREILKESVLYLAQTSDVKNDGCKNVQSMVRSLL